MAIRLDPRYPVVWRSPDTLQVGVDHPLIVLAGVGTGLESVVSALQAGIPRSGAVLLGKQAGASAEAVSALINGLGPALLPEHGAAPVPVADSSPRAVCIDGIGPTADRLLLLLRDLGVGSLSLHDAELAGTGSTGSAPPRREPLSKPPREPALAVIIGDYVLDPRRHARWVRRDIPHLPVIFSDTEVRIGPLVEPGFGACLRCVELAHVDHDAAWPALACQLVSRRSLTETTRISIDVAAQVALIVHDRLMTGSSKLTATSSRSPSLVIDVGTGRIRRRAHRPHERCGCRSLPGNEIAPDQISAAGPASTS